MPRDIDTASYGFPCFPQFIAVNFSAQTLFPCVNSCAHQMLNYSGMPIALSPSSVTNNRSCLSSRLCKRAYVCMSFCCPVPLLISSALRFLMTLLYCDVFQVYLMSRDWCKPCIQVSSLVAPVALWIQHLLSGWTATPWTSSRSPCCP